MANPKLCSIPDCDKPVFGRGWCQSHHYRWRRHGDPLGGRIPPGEAPRFLEDVVLPYMGEDCLFWPYSRNNYGYGKFWCDGRIQSVHRLVCEATHGPAPTPSHEAAHSCGNGHLGCVAATHLSWKTSKENAADKIVHGTTNEGSRNPQAKLTEETVLAIKALEGTMTQRAIAAQFGVSYKLVNSIFRGTSWAWLKAA